MASTSPLIRIVNSTFYRPSIKQPYFPNLNFTLPSLSKSSKPQRWSIIGPSNSGKSTLLQILQGSLTVSPPIGRTYPSITEKQKYPGNSIALVDLSTKGAFGENVRGEYMSSRYEAQRDKSELTLKDWLERTALHLPLYTDNFDFEGYKGEALKAAEVPLEIVTNGLKLTKFLEQPVSTLSNGQGRRARIAQALLRGVDLLLLDEPFMGLDQQSIKQLSSLLESISSPENIDKENKISSQIVLSSRPQDHLPEWITHILYAKDSQVLALGEREEVIEKVKSLGQHVGPISSSARGILEQVYGYNKDNKTQPSREEKAEDKDDATSNEALVEMKDINISYRSQSRKILNNFSWTIRRGERWGLFGPNGSGKTTLLSIVTSDHPLSYAQPVKIFGRTRLPEPGQPGISVFEVQSRIGVSSPEVLQFFPKHLSIEKAVYSAWAETFTSPPNLQPESNNRVERILRYFGLELEESRHQKLRDCSLSTQKLVMFMRAMVKRNDIVILDEAFSGMDEIIRDRSMKYLESHLKDSQSLIVVSHVEEEIPQIVDKWVRLAEAGGEESAVFGERNL